jgi:hypothetical protein
LVLAPSRKLVFTHQWEGSNPVETRVTVELADGPGGTEVTLRQEGFLDPEEAKGHEKGWASTLRKLAKKFSHPSSKSTESKSAGSNSMEPKRTESKSMRQEAS